MAQGLRREEQYLLDTVADFLTQMTELERLREAVRLAEAAAKGMPSSRPVKFESPRSVCRTSTARLTSAGACHVLTSFLRDDPDCEILLLPGGRAA